MGRRQTSAIARLNLRRAVEGYIDLVSLFLPFSFLRRSAMMRTGAGGLRVGPSQMASGGLPVKRVVDHAGRTLRWDTREQVK